MTELSGETRGWRGKLGRSVAWLIGTTLLILLLMALQPLFAIPFVFLFLWLAREKVAAIGLVRAPGLFAVLLAGFGFALAMQIVNRLALIPLLAVFLPDQGASAADIGLVPGAWDVWALFVVIAIFSAGFGEELSARGYALTMVTRLLGDGRGARWIAMSVVAVIFGLGHFYQGALGTAHAIWMGFALGTLYLLSRSLWTAIVGHALYNIFTATLIVSGAMAALERSLGWI
ncbi:MAG: type II CAAX endopeptidase family protein [Pseudomonadota bacterium]